jgi:pyridoxamine 5'-phosphate oxidase
MDQTVLSHPEMLPADDPIRAILDLIAEATRRAIPNPNAMTVSTVGPDGQPSSRTVLLKGADERGLVFYTNYTSRKGREILAHPKVALTFYWRAMEKQAHVYGQAHPVSDEEADAYFATRPRTSQLGAWASKQSEPLSSRAALVAEVAKLEATYFGRAIPRPPHWSGFRVVPHEIQLWSDGLFRLHDRFRYRRDATGAWEVERLAP